jgi:phage terminase small subunit
MSGELTPKQERFAQKYVELGNASEAYRQAYDAENMSSEAVKVEACRLLQNPNVSLTVLELQEEHRERHKVTVHSITQELEEARLLAIQNTQCSAAVSASMGKAKIHGYDKTVLSNDPENPVNASPVTLAVTPDLVKQVVQSVRDEF